jgi:hypothetical protein
MACADVDGLFTIDVEGIGRNSDEAIFRLSRPGSWLEIEGLDLPDPAHLPSDDSS